jgi:hypothetical protein
MICPLTGVPLKGNRYQIAGTREAGDDVRAHLESNGWEVLSLRINGKHFKAVVK